MQRLTLPGTIARGGWTFDARAVREAIAFFKLEWPVEVKLSQGTRRRGAHRAKPARQYLGGGITVTSHFHSITVTTYSQPEDAGRTLWHELCHAAQTEYMGAGFYGTAYAVETRRHGRGYAAYRANKYEVEAREHESLNDTMPLSVSRRPANGRTLRPKAPAPTMVPVDINDLLRELTTAFVAPRPAPVAAPPAPVRPVVAGDRLRVQILTRQLGQAEKARLQLRKAGRDDTAADRECKRIAAERKEVRRQIKNGV